MNNPKIIAFPSKPSKHGGPGSFQLRFEDYLKKAGWQIVYPEDKTKPDVVMVLGGTRKFLWLLKLRLQGVPVFFRLGGINWLFEFKEKSFLTKLKIRMLLAVIPFYQKMLASSIIYQSEFSKKYLLKLGQSAKLKNNAIIYNGVDTDVFKPGSNTNEPISLLCVEGNLDYTPYAIDLINYLQENLFEKSDIKSLIMYGNFENQKSREKLSAKIDYRGYVDKKTLPEIYKNAIYLSLDINAACPNAAIEAMACGCPVVGFDTGALKELVPSEAGIIVPYGGDPWKLDHPDFSALITAVNEVQNHWERYSKGARTIAVERYSIEDMVDKYYHFFTESNRS